jgi:hypothetical protein
MSAGASARSTAVRTNTFNVGGSEMPEGIRRLLSGFVLMALAAPAVAQPVPESSSVSTPDLAREVEALRISVERAVGLLDRALTHQRAELLLKRIELKERRVVPLESEVRRARTDLLAAESEIERLEQMLENTEDAIVDEIRNGTDRADSGSRTMKREIEQGLAFARTRVETEESHVRLLQDDLADRLDEIDILEDSLEHRLEQLP